MANERLGMTKIRQIFRLRQEGMSYRKISERLDISRDSATKYGALFESSGLSYSAVEQMSDTELTRVFETVNQSDSGNLQKLIDSFPDMEKKLSKTGMTRMNLWSRYKLETPDGYNYSRFCFYFKEWQKNTKASMHFEHKSGDKMYIDFTGKKLQLTNQISGELKEVEVFVAILGASQLTYVEAVETQRKEDFINATENALFYFGGVTQAIVPDNLKSAVNKSCKYEPILNTTFEDFALHYGTTILPTRSYKPKDKALVEGAVKIVYNRIFAEISERIFFSLSELNRAIRQELVKYNNVKLTGRTLSRRQLFEEIEASELMPLPQKRYEIKGYHMATVSKTSHVWFGIDRHYYSAPYQYLNKKVQIIYTKTMVEIYHNHERIASHPRDKQLNGYTTIAEHMPSTHQFVAEWNPDKFINWAHDIGEPTEELIRKVLQTKRHPEQGYKSCAGILSYGRKVGNNRLNSACSRAMYYNSYSYRTIKNIIDKGLDKTAIAPVEQYQLPDHDNIRGSQYYR